MKTFEYKGFDTTGKTARGLVEALDIKEARERLSARGILPERIAPAGNRAARARSTREEFELGQRATVYRETGALLKAGLPLAGALDVLINAPELGDTRVRLAGIRDRIREGGTFAAALAASSTRISAFESAMVESGERAGTLDVVLEKMAGFLEEEEKLRDRVQTALIYPAIVFTLAVAVGVVMLGVMIPRIGKLLSETGMALPLLTRVTMAAAKWLLPATVVLLIAGAAGAAFLRRAQRGDANVRRRVERRLFALPLVGPGYRTLLTLRFARTLAMLLSGGVGLVEAVALAGRATGSTLVASDCEAASDLVKHGRPLADALRTVPCLSESLPGWVQAGESSGRLEDLLENAANRYQQQWERLVTRSLSVLEPILILAVGAFVLFVSLSILLPVLSLNRGLSP